MSGTVKENLVAAKALVDTPEKFNSFGSVHAVLHHVDAEYGGVAFVAFLQEPGTGRGYITHEEIMDRFDRAIAAQDVQS